MQKISSFKNREFVMSKLLRTTLIWLVCICAVEVIHAPAQTFNTLFDFDGTNGANPNYVTLFQGTDGNLYGTTSVGGLPASSNCSGGCGTVFKISTAGKLTVLHDFCTTASCLAGKVEDGEFPEAGVIQGLDGNFYGTASGNSPSPGEGLVFKITPAGTLTILYTFCAVITTCADGASPTAPLVQGTDGNFYGTTTSGGTGFENSFGTVFKVTPTGAHTILYSFCSKTNCTDGMNPEAGLVQASDGNFYGTTNQGGTNQACLGGCGTLFRITPAGKQTTLHNFCSAANCADGANPIAGLIQATDGNLYGTTFQGGANGAGTIFKISLSGSFSVFYTFGTEDGTAYAPLLQASDGNFYGTTNGGGETGQGMIFKITPAEKLTVLYSFDSVNANPVSGLMQDTNGKFYGTTYSGLTNVNCLFTGGCGTVYSLSTGLGAFVKTEPTYGKVGSTIIIIGTNLTGASAVSFNGTAASFKVVSSSEITAVVPSAAKSGPVSVTTPSGILKTVVGFKVTPVITSFTPESGPVGTEVTITGTGLTGATAVTFGGVKATTFSVKSATEVTADVPTGAKTGAIAITTPGGTATTSETFTVTD
jgi:uncharacterized repeat protein (TIGR03803 family)